MDTKNISSKLGLFLKVLFGILVIVWGGSFFSWRDPYWQEAGAFMGKFAIYMLWITVIPGILSRFRVSGMWQRVQIVLMTNRRWLGICMFQFAILHYFWSAIFRNAPVIMAGGIPTIMPFEVFGFLTFFLLFPLFVTSNSVAQRILKQNWKRIHRLIYVAMWTVTAHVVLQPPISFVFLGVPVGLEYTLSYGVPSLVLIYFQIWSLRVASRRQKRTVPA